MQPVSRSATAHGSSDYRDRRPEIAPAQAASPPTAGSEQRAYAGSGVIPGAELPAFVYLSVFAAFGWIMLASWLTFARGGDADLAIGMAIVLAIVFFALPVIIYLVGVAFLHPKREPPRDFLASPVETATGPLPGSSAWLQVLIIPLSLALAATLIGTAYLLVR